MNEARMKNLILLALLFGVFAIGTAASQDAMIITFRNGTVQNIDTSAISKIEFRSTQGQTSTSSPSTITKNVPQETTSGCWTGHFAGLDTSGYSININLVEKNGTVEGGYSYFHKAQGKSVTAVISNVVINSDVLRGKWKQTQGIIAEGTFEWKWLSSNKCQAFEGAFDNVKFWNQMRRQ
jgi:hypothetical protein